MTPHFIWEPCGMLTTFTLAFRAGLEVARYLDFDCFVLLWWNSADRSSLLTFYSSHIRRLEILGGFVVGACDLLTFVEFVPPLQYAFNSFGVSCLPCSCS